MLGKYESDKQKGKEHACFEHWISDASQTAQCTADI